MQNEPELLVTKKTKVIRKLIWKGNEGASASAAETKKVKTLSYQKGNWSSEVGVLIRSCARETAQAAGLLWPGYNLHSFKIMKCTILKKNSVKHSVISCPKNVIIYRIA